MGRAPQTRAMHKATWGKPLFEVIAERSPGIDIALFRKLLVPAHAVWIEEKRIDVIPPENMRALDSLIADGKQLFILTSRTHDEIMHLLQEDHDLTTRVKTIYYRDIMPFHKPDPRAFETLLQENDLLADECIYVGDAPSDAEATKGAHMHFLACLEAGIRTKQDFRAYAVDGFAERFTDVPKTVRAIEAKLQ